MDRDQRRSDTAVRQGVAGQLDHLGGWATRPWAGVTLAVALLAILQAAIAAWRQDWTYDEPLHLAWSERLLDQRIAERQTNRRYDSKTPVMAAHVLARRLVERAGEEDGRLLRFAARLPTVAVLGALLAAVYGLCRSLAGATAARLALMLSALDPNLIAHGSLATVDLPLALATVLSVWAALRLADRPSAVRALLLGCALGLALATKFSALLLLPVLLALPPLFRLGRSHPGVGLRHWWVWLAAAGMAATLVVCGFYLFQDVGVAFAEAGWRSGPFRYIAFWCPHLRLPLPLAFLTGIDVSMASERWEWNSVIFGRRHPTGVWYYFLALALLKTPLASLLAAGAGLARCLRPLRVDRRLQLVALALLIHLGYFSFLFRTQVGYRFVLMCLPLGYVLAGVGLGGWVRARPATWLGCLALVLALAENALYVGNPLSFTNAAVWPKRQVFRLVADSNVDWGQNRDKIDGWLRERRLARSHLDPLHPLPGHNTFSLNRLAGVFDFEQLRWLRENADPGGHFGHTYLWFDVGNALFDRFLDEERTLATGGLAETLCPTSLVYEHHPPGSRVSFTRHDPPASSGRWILCVVTEKGMDLGLRTREGQIRFGPLVGLEACRTELLSQGEIAWYRLGPGRHALCAEEIPNRRSYLPYYFEGEWIVRRRGGSLNLRRTFGD